MIDGKTLGIMAYCRDSLRHLRDMLGSITIFIGAVCIAPEKVDKGTQIPLMTDIYGKARTVYIWLGNPHPGGRSERALKWLENVSLNQSILDVKALSILLVFSKLVGF